MLSMPYKRNGEEHVVDPRGAAHLDCFWSGWSGVRSGVVSRPLWCSRGLTCIASRNHRTDATVVSFFGSRAGHVLAGICARACNSSPVHRIVKFRSLAPILVRWVATLRSTSITLWFNVMLQHCRIPNLVFRVSLVRWTHFHTLFLYSRSSWLQPCEPRRTLYVHGHRLFVPGGPQHQVLGSRARRHGGILRHDVSCVCQRREHCGGEHRVSRLGRHAVSQSDAHCTCVHVPLSALSIDPSRRLSFASSSALSHPFRAHQVAEVARTRAAWPAASSARVDVDVAVPPWRAREAAKQPPSDEKRRPRGRGAPLPYRATWKAKVTWDPRGRGGSSVVKVESS